MVVVKSKNMKILRDVLRQILQKYNFNLENSHVSLVDGTKVDIDQSVSTIENQRLFIHLKESEKRPAAPPSIKVHVNTTSPTLEEITNKVYEDILQEKADTDCLKPKSDKSSVKVSLYLNKFKGLEINRSRFVLE